MPLKRCIQSSMLAATITLSLSAHSSNMEDCYLNGLSDKIQCGSLALPKDYQDPSLGTLDIHFSVIPATKKVPGNAPLVAISGGPGQSAIESGAMFERTFNRVRQQHDILLIDQRGTGKSSPLQCQQPDFAETLAQDDTKLDIHAEMQACFEQLPEHPKYFSSYAATQDLEAIRKHLGYDKLHLYGISYGTRMAQMYSQYYPQNVVTQTLDGVVPPQINVMDVNLAVDRALDKLIEDCQGISGCQSQFGDIKSRLHTLVAKLKQQPIHTRVAHPSTGQIVPMLLTPSKFLGSLRMALYSPQSKQLIPYLISQTEQGNYQPLLGVMSLFSDGAGISMGMHFAIVCGEDYPRLTKQEKASMQQSLIGADMLNTISNACDIWQVPDNTATLGGAPQHDIPTLLLSGDKDPATPPAWGDIAMEKLTNARHLVAAHGTHGIAQQSCGNKLIAQFIQNKDANALEAACLDTLTSEFFKDANSLASHDKESK
ncbi:alpha/beta hydrolase [Paraferrimonas sp. SM1919]|uniref:alpha/beta hydrolase n=1 Tax=Paraferrimonas sp. SM1919 TaxID=2662263 RepID=UPI0013D827FF|nr:alpha/beta fold hydrolase [Paraferrimonas sp. SM1919]